MKHRFIILFLFLNCFLLSNAATVKSAVKFIDHEELLKHNFDPSAYANYQQAFQDSVTTFFQDSKVGQNVKIIQTLEPNLFPFYSFSAKPALHDTMRHALQQKLMSIAPIASKYLPFSSEIIFTINGGCKDRGLDYSPQLTNPKKLRQSRYEYGNLEQNFGFIIDWLQSGGMPLAISLHKKNIKNDPNIRLSKQQLQAFSTAEDGLNNIVEGLYSDNSFYWQIQLVKDPKDRSLVVFKAMVMAYIGRIQYAQRILQMVYQFEPNNSVLRYLMDEFNWRMNYYLQKEAGILQGVSRTYNDSQQNADLKKLTEILEINPMSSNTLMRLFTLEFGTEYVIYPWTVEQNNFRASDPMRMDTLPARSKEEAYINALRISTTDMFVDAETFDSDFPKYAEIALKLGAYDFAADLYWILFKQAEQNNNKNAELYFDKYLYAQNKTDAGFTYGKRIRRDFKRLDKKLRKDMKRHPRYKNFKN